MEAIKEEIELANRILSIETGKIAKQANGAVTVRYGDTVILVTAVASKEIREGIDFLPLLVDYREKTYSAGKIPGGFFKREGRPTTKEILNGRLVDRSIRPLFSPLARNNIQVSIAVLSVDQVNDPDILGVIGASAAFCVSDIPFPVFVGAVRIGKVGDEYIINPTYQDMEKSKMDLVVSGTRDGILMLETGAKEICEEDLLKGIELAMEPLAKISELQEKLAARVKEVKEPLILLEIDPDLKKKAKELSQNEIEKVLFGKSKEERTLKLNQVFSEMKKSLNIQPEQEAQAKEIFEDMKGEIIRKNILEGKRVDGRNPEELRPISCEVGILPRTHGSALFMRGETQSLVVVTLGTSEEKQRIDDIEEETSKSFILHYNFPSFSTGEVRPDRGPGRREIGHGALAEKAILSILPSEEEFPYTIRVVSDILESNGSSSMATVCGASLSLMDAGVPIKKQIAGVAMGLVKEGDKSIILTDITGLEDHFGDMDFKISGTSDGICALQLDLKTAGVDIQFLRKILGLGMQKISFIIDKMNQVIEKPHSELSGYAPRIYIHQIKPDKIGALIGPGGKTIKSIVEETGVKIDVQDDGKVLIASADEKKAREALEMVQCFTAEVEIGKIYTGKVVRIMDFGVFVEIFPGKDGLVHISQLEDKYVENVRSVVKEGDEIPVKVIDIDAQGRIVLSRKQALRESKEKTG